MVLKFLGSEFFDFTLFLHELPSAEVHALLVVFMAHAFVF